MELVLNDDYETLQAALAIIDEWDVELSLPTSESSKKECVNDAVSASTATDSDGLSSSSQSPTSSPPAATTPVTKPTNSRRRKVRSEDEVQPVQMQRREELVFLRDKVRELETQLQQIKDDSNTVVKGDNNAEQRALDASWVWQQIASRQLEHRQTSERENLKLRVMVEEQLKIAKDLMRVLVQAFHRCEEAKQKEDDVVFKRVKLPRDGFAAISDEDQLQRVHELYDESDAMFSEAPFVGRPPVFRDINVLEHENGETTINLESSWVVPYSVDRVAGAFWRYLEAKTGRQDCRFEESVDNASDVLVTRYESSATAARLMGTFVGRFVAKRFQATENKPDSMIWDMRGEPVNFKPISMDGVRLHNETVTRVLWADGDNRSGSLNGEARMAMIQTCTRVHIQFAASETPTRRRRVGALTNYAMFTVESELNWKQQVLEDLLLRGNAE